jgi:hypothetical protein
MMQVTQHCSQKNIKQLRLFLTIILTDTRRAIKYMCPWETIMLTFSDKSNAIINYKKSLAIEDIADIRKKLEKVQGK